MTTYDALVAAHIIGAVSWVGGNTYIQISGTRIIRRNNADELAGFTADLDYLAPRWFIPISLWTVLFGVSAAINGPWKFSDPWIDTGLTMFIISFLIGIAYLKPQTEKLIGIGESDGISSPPYTEKLGQILTASRIELGLLWLTVLVMVIKPG